MEIIPLTLNLMEEILVNLVISLYFILPIIALYLLRKRYPASLWIFCISFLVFYLINTPANAIFDFPIQDLIDKNYGILTAEYLKKLTSAFSAGFFENIFKYIFVLFLPVLKKNRSISAIMMYTLGHAYAELVGHGFQFALAENFPQFKTGFSASPIISISLLLIYRCTWSIFFHFVETLLVYSSIKMKKMRFLFVAILCHMLFDFMSSSRHLLYNSTWPHVIFMLTFFCLYFFILKELSKKFINYDAYES